MYLMMLFVPSCVKVMQKTVRSSKKTLVHEIAWLRKRGYVKEVQLSREEYRKQVEGVRKLERVTRGRYGRMVFYRSTLKPLWEYWEDEVSEAHKRLNGAKARFPTKKDYALLEKFLFSEETQKAMLTAAFFGDQRGLKTVKSMNMLDVLTKFFILALARGTDAMTTRSQIDSRAVEMCDALERPRELLVGLKHLRPTVPSPGDVAQGLYGLAPYASEKV